MATCKHVWERVGGYVQCAVCGGGRELRGWKAACKRLADAESIIKNLPVEPVSPSYSGVFALVGGNAAVHAVSGTFDRMKIAEELIVEARRRCTSAGESTRVNDCFGALCPPDCMRDKDDRVYRAHARELIERARLAQDPRPGTDAECLCALLDHSLKAPPNDNAAAACERLFHAVMAPVPEHLFKLWARERWDGASLELIQGLRGKCGNPTRKFGRP